MYNAFQPFVNLTNANLALFHRLTNSSDITRLMQEAVGRAMTIPQDSMNKAAQTDAYSDWTRGLVDNVTRFTQEYVNGVTQSMARTQNFMSRQVAQGSMQFAQIADDAEEALEETATAARRVAKTATRRTRKNTR